MSPLLQRLLILGCVLCLEGCAIVAIDPPKDNVPGDAGLVWVVAPIEPDNETFVVRFGSNLVPGTFSSQLDGADVTPIWLPHNAGANGSAKLVYVDIFRNGNCAPRSYPWKPNPYPPVSPIVCSHDLHGHADSASSNSPPYTDRSVDFVPVQLGLIGKDSNNRYLAPGDVVPITPGQAMTVTVTAMTYGPWPTEQAVAVEALDLLQGEPGAPGYISLNGQAPGQKVFLNNIPGDFRVSVVGNLGAGTGTFRFRLRARAMGTQEFVYANLFACRAGGC